MYDTVSPPQVQDVLQILLNVARLLACALLKLLMKHSALLMARDVLDNLTSVQMDHVLLVELLILLPIVLMLSDVVVQPVPLSSIAASTERVLMTGQNVIPVLLRTIILECANLQIPTSVPMVIVLRHPQLVLHN